MFVALCRYSGVGASGTLWIWVGVVPSTPQPLSLVPSAACILVHNRAFTHCESKPNKHLEWLPLQRKQIRRRLLVTRGGSTVVQVQWSSLFFFHITEELLWLKQSILCIIVCNETNEAQLEGKVTIHTQTDKNIQAERRKQNSLFSVSSVIGYGRRTTAMNVNLLKKFFFKKYGLHVYSNRPTKAVPQR